MTRPSSAARATPAIPRKARPAFAAALARHLTDGSAPGGPRPGGWSDAAFARTLPSVLSVDERVSPRSVSNWRKGTALPGEIGPILDALFGVGDGAGPRGTLERLYRAARDERDAAAAAGAKLDPAGAVWIVVGDRLAIDRPARPADLRAAKAPTQQRMQAEAQDVAARLAGSARRPANAALVERIGLAASTMAAFLTGDPPAIQQHLERLYRLSLELALALEADAAMGREDTPLTAEMRLDLTLLLRIVAPWLRGFPSVAKRELDAVGPEARPALLPHATRLVRAALDAGAIGAEDADDARDWLSKAESAASKPGPAAHTAARRGLGGAMNLLLAAARLLTAARLDPASVDPALRHRLSETMTDAQDSVAAFAEVVQADLGHALRGLTEASSVGGGTGQTGGDEAGLPKDFLEQAKAMILAGQASPLAWRPLIRELRFFGEPLSDLAPLAGLTALTSLDLSFTRIADLAPLARLTALTSLNLWNTQIADIAPLAGLTALTSLGLSHTQIADIAPLAGLTALTSLYLGGTQIADIAPLAGLTALTSLDLRDTKIADIAPLAGLGRLSELLVDDPGQSGLGLLRQRADLMIATQPDPDSPFVRTGTATS